MHETEARERAAPLVVAVVLTWNDTEMTARCLRSVLDSDHPNLRVLLVDNGSAEPCGERLAAEFPEIELLVLPRNQGFTGGSNRGMAHALELGADYVHLLGNDSVLAPNAISLLVHECEARPRVGGASPLILDPGEDQIVQFYYATLDRDFCWHEHHEDRMRLDSRDWPMVESEFVPFIAVMFRAQTLCELGLFDESFGTCWEDYDYCIRLADAGWKLLMVTDAHAVHISGGTTGYASPYITYYNVRNRLVCLFRYGKRTAILRNTFKIARSFYRQLKANGWSNWQNHRAMARGLLDFLLGVTGEGHPPKNRRG